MFPTDIVKSYLMSFIGDYFKKLAETPYFMTLPRPADYWTWLSLPDCGETKQLKAEQKLASEEDSSMVAVPNRQIQTNMWIRGKKFRKKHPRF